MERRRVMRLALAWMVLSACASEDNIGAEQQPVSCVAGSTVPCACLDGSEGVQACAPTGDAYLACMCAGAGTGGYPSTGTGGYPSPATGGLPAGTGGVPDPGGGFPPPAGDGGAPDPGAGGVPPENTGGVPVEPPTPPPPPGSREPTVPPITTTCPAFVNSTISFMGLGGIRIEAGPKAAGPTAPIVFYWHGTGSTSGEFAFMASAVHQGVMSEGGVLVSFQGTTGGDLTSGTSIFGAGDLDLVDQLFACAVRDHNVDPRRVYVTGCSAGGLFSAAMAARRSSYVAAAAPNSGGWVVPSQFQTDYTPALMTMHGRPGGDVVVVDFSNTSRSADDAFKARGGFVINCNHGGGHCGASGLAGDVWQFFKAHPYGVDPLPWTGGLPPGFASSCQIY